jgi:hypothetical protein
VRLLLAMLLILVLVACSSSPPTITPPAGEAAAGGTGPASNIIATVQIGKPTPTPDPNAKPITVKVTNTELGLGFERITFRIYDQAGKELTSSDLEVAVRILTAPTADRPSTSVASGPAFYFGLGTPAGSSWVTYTEFDSSGPWLLEATATRPDGWKGVGQGEMTVAGRTALPRVGTTAPIVDNPTLAQGDVSKITSDANPDPDLYRLTMQQATTNGRPTVIFLGSPKYCPTDICQGTLGEIKAMKTQYGDRVNFIHIETHDLANPKQFSPAAQAWHLPSEPWTFLLDKDGHIVNRIEGPLSRVELDLLLKRLLSGQTGAGGQGQGAAEATPASGQTAP